jgi:hypothetical protein
MAYDFFIQIEYDLDKDRAIVSTNVKHEQVDDLLADFLRTQMGEGEDRRKAAERRVYHINLELDLDGDVFRVSDDTGNKSLRDGIIACIRGRWTSD